MISDPHTIPDRLGLESFEGSFNYISGTLEGQEIQISCMMSQAPKTSVPKERMSSQNYFVFYDEVLEIKQCQFYYILFIEAVTKVHPASREEVGPTCLWGVERRPCKTKYVTMATFGKCNIPQFVLWSK